MIQLELFWISDGRSDCKNLLQLQSKCKTETLPRDKLIRFELSPLGQHDGFVGMPLQILRAWVEGSQGDRFSGGPSLARRPLARSFGCRRAVVLRGNSFIHRTSQRRMTCREVARDASRSMRQTTVQHSSSKHELDEEAETTTSTRSSTLLLICRQQVHSRSLLTQTIAVQKLEEVSLQLAHSPPPPQTAEQEQEQVRAR